MIGTASRRSESCAPRARSRSVAGSLERIRGRRSHGAREGPAWESQPPKGKFEEALTPESSEAVTKATLNSDRLQGQFQN
eukprot:7416209-Alexandrium_andersonii.AAC.1